MNRFEQLKDILMTENCFKMICGAGNEDAPYVNLHIGWSQDS